ASVFATAVTASTPVWLLVLMIALVVASGLLWYSIVALFMSSAPVMKRFQHARHWIERVAGASLILIGGRIIADARNPVAPSPDPGGGRRGSAVSPRLARRGSRRQQVEDAIDRAGCRLQDALAIFLFLAGHRHRAKPGSEAAAEVLKHFGVAARRDHR